MESTSSPLSSSRTSSPNVPPAVGLLFNLGLVFAPHIGYVIQFFEIAKTRDIDGYAPLVSFILLVSNTLRIEYFFGRRYAVALFFQSIVAVLVHLVLLIKVLAIHTVNERLRVEVSEGARDFVVPWGRRAGQTASDGSPPAGKIEPGEADLPPALPPFSADQLYVPDPSPNAEDIIGDDYDYTGISLARRNWLFRMEEGLGSFLMNFTPQAFLFYCVVSGVLSCMLVFSYYLITGPFWSDAAEVVGYLALGVEALLVLPQICRNARRGSTEGLSLLLVLTWVLGDAAKIVYFILSKQPLPFMLCGCFQLSLDFVVIGQLIYYRYVPHSRGLPYVHGNTTEGYSAGVEAQIPPTWSHARATASQNGAGLRDPAATTEGGNERPAVGLVIDTDADDEDKSAQRASQPS